jgi:hypothetical protein
MRELRTRPKPVSPRAQEGAGPPPAGNANTKHDEIEYAGLPVTPDVQAGPVRGNVGTY